MARHFSSTSKGKVYKMYSEYSDTFTGLKEVYKINLLPTMELKLHSLSINEGYVPIMFAFRKQNFFKKLLSQTSTPFILVIFKQHDYILEEAYQNDEEIRDTLRKYAEQLKLCTQINSYSGVPSDNLTNLIDTYIDLGISKGTIFPQIAVLIQDTIEAEIRLLKTQQELLKNDITHNALFGSNPVLDSIPLEKPKEKEKKPITAEMRKEIEDEKEVALKKCNDPFLKWLQMVNGCVGMRLVECFISTEDLLEEVETNQHKRIRQCQNMTFNQVYNLLVNEIVLGYCKVDALIILSNKEIKLANIVVNENDALVNIRQVTAQLVGVIIKRSKMEKHGKGLLKQQNLQYQTEERTLTKELSSILYNHKMLKAIIMATSQNGSI